MTKKTVGSLVELLLITILLAALVIGGAEKDSLKAKIDENEAEISKLNADLKSYGGLLLERDIKLHEKDSTIQQLSSQNEGLSWQLQEGEEHD